MKVSKKLLVKDKTSMGAKIVGKKVPAKVDTGKIAVDFPEKKLMASSRSRKKAVNAMPKIKRSPPLFINESETTEGPYIYVDEKDVEVSIQEENSVVDINEDDIHIENPDYKIIIGNPYECKFCQKILSDKYVLKRHERIHTRVKQFPCKFCYENFPQKENLKEHQNLLQCKVRSLTQKTIDEKKKYSCESCNNVYLSKKSLRSHEKVHLNPNLCKFCSKAFQDEYTLQRHVRMHTGEKPFSCNMCYKQFSQKSGLKYHQNILQCRIKLQNKETSNKKEKYSCTICNKIYLSKGSFQSHKKLHDNPHTCIFCSKEFPEKHFLATHERIHTGEKPFSCNFCRMKFTQQHHLKSHELNRHSV